VWEPFFRIEQGTPEQVATGTGLGLAVVRQLAQVMGGNAWIEDSPGGGARFVVTLPGRRVALVREAVA
jgi:signal transduction histidine kinase